MNVEQKIIDMAMNGVDAGGGRSIIDIAVIVCAEMDESGDDLYAYDSLRKTVHVFGERNAQPAVTDWKWLAAV